MCYHYLGENKAVIPEWYVMFEWKDCSICSGYIFVRAWFVPAAMIYAWFSIQNTNTILPGILRDKTMEDELLYNHKKLKMRMKLFIILSFEDTECKKVFF